MTRPRFRIDQPQPNDLVGDPLLLAGMGGGFEGTIDIRILGADGSVLLETFTTGTNMISAWQASVELPDPLPTRGVVELAEGTGLEEAVPRVSVPVFFGPGIVEGFGSHFLRVVQAGDTLSGIAASEPGFIGSGPGPIFEANRDILSDPDLIHPGQVLRIPAG